jgi:hypothetical protein
MLDLYGLVDLLYNWHLLITGRMFARGLLYPCRGSDLLAVLLSGAEFRFETDVVIREFAHLCFVNTDNLGLLVAAETERTSGEVVHEPQDDGLQELSVSKGKITFMNGIKRTVMTKE